MAEVAAAGAMLHVEGLDEKNMSKMTSRSAATMHDQQNHLIQRTCAREAIGHSPKIVQWDEGSKRGKAWVAAAMVASRESGDGSRLRELFFSFLERCVYHFEGLGAELPAVSPIRIAFDASLGSQGWQLVSLCDEYQSDGSSCGVWLQAARDAWLRYVASTDHGSKIFAAFLRRTFEAAGVHSLSSLRGRVLGAAQRGNEAYILGQRAAMRSRLVHAALAEKLSWGSASLAGFAPATAVNLDSFDEQPNDAMV
jgi:hypothetical protein